MSLLTFIILLAVLVFVHELGHFIAAKIAGIRVDEFAVGFPPRLFSFQKGETLYSINIIPFGGFVKIFGEDYEESAALSVREQARSFSRRNRGVQAFVLASGIFFNTLFAWALISFGFMTGLPAPVGEYKGVTNPELVVTALLPDSPAERAGLKTGDVILSLSDENRSLAHLSVSDAQEFIAHVAGNLLLTLRRGTDSLAKKISPEDGIVPGKKAIGIAMDEVGIIKLSPIRAFIEGAKTTFNVSVAVAAGIFNFIRDALFGHADLSQVVGPVGLAGLVGEATKLGFVYLLSFTAFISLNLAVINLIPFPALDGGRLLFVAIESVTRRRINPKIASALNLLGFALILLFMATVTYHDIARLF